MILLRILYLIYQVCIAAPILLVITLLVAFATTFGCTFLNASWWSYYPGKFWSIAMIRVLLLPVHVEGRENLKPGQSYVIIPNHQGSFDIFLIYGFLGRHFKWMLKEELRHMPLIGKSCESAGFIFVDQKGGPKKTAMMLLRAREILKEGVSVVVFPEGARTWDGRLRKFKRGPFQLADQLHLPLLPVTINGSFEVLPRTKGYVNFVKWHPLRLTIHPAIVPEGKGPEAERATMEQAHEIIGSALKTIPNPPKEGTFNPED